MNTATPEIGKAKKPGLLGAPRDDAGRGRGTPGPDGGYALTLTERAVHDLHVADVTHHDLVAGVAALAAKRAGLLGRGPSIKDVHAALDLFEFRATSPEPAVVAARATLFAGIGHSYFATRALVDAVDVDDLLGTQD
jgi:hypothetical protein